MEVFFNELSCSPVAATKEESKAKIINLLETLKSLRKDGINVMRTAENFYALELAVDYTVTHFFNDPTVSRDIKTLFRGVTKNPYIEDADSYEAEMFILSDFQTTDENGSILSPEALAIAYVSNSPVGSNRARTIWSSNG